MLEKILGNKTAEKVMLYLFHYGEIYPTAIARDASLSVSQVQKQLERFEESGVLISKLVGRTRVYMFNPKSPLVGPLKDLIKIVYEAIPLQEKEVLFKTRRRPRRKNKPILRKAHGN